MQREREGKRLCFVCVREIERLTSYWEIESWMRQALRNCIAKIEKKKTNWHTKRGNFNSIYIKWARCLCIHSSNDSYECDKNFHWMACVEMKSSYPYTIHARRKRSACDSFGNSIVFFFLGAFGLFAFMCQKSHVNLCECFLHIWFSHLRFFAAKHFHRWNCQVFIYFQKKKYTHKIIHTHSRARFRRFI